MCSMIRRLSYVGSSGLRFKVRERPLDVATCVPSSRSQNGPSRQRTALQGHRTALRLCRMFAIFHVRIQTPLDCCTAPRVLCCPTGCSQLRLAGVGRWLRGVPCGSSTRPAVHAGLHTRDEMVARNCGVHMMNGRAEITPSGVDVDVTGGDRLYSVPGGGSVRLLEVSQRQLDAVAVDRISGSHSLWCAHISTLMPPM